MLITINENTLSLSSGNTVIFPHQTWEDYERLLNLRQEKSTPKLSFNLKTKEIRLMSPLPSHGNRIDTLRDLVKIMLGQKGLDWQCFDPITLKIPPKAGVEPDTCFYIENRQAILGKDKIDLTVEPPPDLAIEVDFTSITDIGAYEILKIPELWIYRQGVLKVYLLQGEGYQESAISRLFPDIDVKNILPKYVELGWNQGSSIALRQFSNL
ncbi:Uma2 family endonuclease [Crocosphaera sp. XPORK-15E]|uniref:Uma2 family endonuclease n=1 Tax=Crocosphaera sp. XPORK-15E TaxID=3110247 RepID=UPI002B21AD0D|nr:Uma2 family endonuclease [Crocosphaera sp. XPORK-15E]MEA5537171.1 Uma2 family endonuclease [Crocosphaera sp. XPORK-15E]